MVRTGISILLKLSANAFARSHRMPPYRQTEKENEKKTFSHTHTGKVTSIAERVNEREKVKQTRREDDVSHTHAHTSSLSL